MEINDKVKIISDNSYWNEKEGKILEIYDDGSYDVRVKIDDDKNIIQNFLENELDLIYNESLNESKDFMNTTLKNFYNKMDPYTLHDLLKDYSLNDLSDWGLDGKITIAFTAKSDFLDELWEYNLEYVFKTNKNTYIILKGEDPLDFDIEEYSQKELIDLIKSIGINEPVKEIQEEKDLDFLHDYLYYKTENKNIATWYFVDKIAAAEGYKAAEVVDNALKFNYKLFIIEAPAFSKFVVAAKEITAKDIYNDYADYLQGNAKVTEVK